MKINKNNPIPPMLVRLLLVINGHTLSRFSQFNMSLLNKSDRCDTSREVYPINIFFLLSVGIVFGALITYFYGHIPIILYIIVLLILTIILPMKKRLAEKKAKAQSS